MRLSTAEHKDLDTKLANTEYLLISYTLAHAAYKAFIRLSSDNVGTELDDYFWKKACEMQEAMKRVGG